MVATIVILLFLAHPNIVKFSFGIFSCEELDSGEWWMVDDLNVKCWDDTHIFFCLAVALPSIVIWGIGIPTVCLFFLYRNKRNLGGINVRIRFGFLFNGYNDKHYFWEFVILYRKIIITCCSVFLSTISIPIQALTVMIVLLICLVL
mmetsp:Transcript_4575/g.614  ORF Transcript_4575/g.614 Transcript_4575/m.614 type:complete len:147 (-) Transcript_4575:394-834(-)